MSIPYYSSITEILTFIKLIKISKYLVKCEKIL